MRCVWAGRDQHGRPYCEHGPAVKDGDGWCCRHKHHVRRVRYRASDKGREQRARENANPHTRSAKQLYELTRVRVP